MSLERVLRHLVTTHWSARRRFPREVLAAIEREIRAVEAQHAGEIRFAVESALDAPHLWRRTSPRERALQVFSQLRVWDTTANNGVLIYLLLADRVVEIIADRGVAARVSEEEWASVCREMEQEYRLGRFLEGSRVGVRRIGELLARHFPGARGDANELPDPAVVL